MSDYMGCEIEATFKSCNVQKGKTVIQLELDAEWRHTLPTLAQLAGQKVRVQLESDQAVMFVDSGQTNVALPALPEVEAETVEEREFIPPTVDDPDAGDVFAA